MKKIITYKGFENEILSEEKSIRFESSLYHIDPVFINLDPSERMTPCKILKTLNENIGSGVVEEFETCVVTTIRYQKYSLRSIMSTRSGLVVMERKYILKDGKYIFDSKKIIDEMY